MEEEVKEFKLFEQSNNNGVIEVGWRDGIDGEPENQLLMWVDFNYLDGFMELFSSFFEDSCVYVTLKEDSVCINISDMFMQEVNKELLKLFPLSEYGSWFI